MLSPVSVPSKTTFNPVEASSEEIVSQLMSPTLVIFPSDTLIDVDVRAADARAANVPAAAELAPITAPSIAPPSMLTALEFWEAIVPASDIVLRACVPVWLAL